MIYIISGCYHNFFFPKRHCSVMYIFEFTCMHYRLNISYDLLSCSLWEAAHFSQDQLFFSREARLVSLEARLVSLEACLVSRDSLKHLVWNILLTRSRCAYRKQLLVCYKMRDTVWTDRSLNMRHTNISKVCNNMLTSIICFIAEREIFNHNSQRKQPCVYEVKEI